MKKTVAWLLFPLMIVGWVVVGVFVATAVAYFLTRDAIDEWREATKS